MAGRVTEIALEKPLGDTSCRGGRVLNPEFVQHALEGSQFQRFARRLRYACAVDTGPLAVNVEVDILAVPTRGDVIPHAHFDRLRRADPWFPAVDVQKEGKMPAF